MPPQGTRLCTCETCGSCGQVVAAAEYRRHQQRQRHRKNRASHASLVASLFADPAGSTQPHDRLVEQDDRVAADCMASAQLNPQALAQPSSPIPLASGSPTTTATLASLNDQVHGLVCPQPQPSRAFVRSPTPPLLENGSTYDPFSPPSPGPPAIVATAQDDPDNDAHAFDEAFFAEEDNQQIDAVEIDAAVDLDEDVMDLVDTSEAYRLSTTHEQRISAGLIDAYDFPHVSRCTAALPQWQRYLYVFVLWLSCRYHLSEQLATTLLRFTGGVLLPALAASGYISGASPPSLKITTPAVKKCLGLEPPLVRYVVCPQCTDLYPWSIKDRLEMCSSCGARLHQPADQLSLLPEASSARPQVFYAVSPLRSWLEGLVQSPEIEDALDKAFGEQAVPATAEDGRRLYRDIQDGAQWRAGLDQCGAPFASDPLSLYLTIGVDWFSPFKINNASWHSSGAITMMVNNLPGALRHRTAHLAAMMPGPQETSEDSLGKYLSPIVEELKLLDRGIWVVTPRSGRRRLLRARLLLFCGDTPARAKVCGFLGHRAGSFCSSCLASRLRRHLSLKTHEMRDPDAHRADAIKARLDQADPTVSRTAREENARQRGARWSELYKLSYWRSVTSALPDAMHAVFLGIVKRFWHRFFVDAVVALDASLLARPQACIAGYKGPLTMKRPDKRLGDRGGGNPNADQWCCLARNLLVFQFADLFDDALCRSFDGSDGDFIRAKFPKSAASHTPVKRPYVEEAMRTSPSNAAVVIEDVAPAEVTPAATATIATSLSLSPGRAGPTGPTAPAAPATQAQMDPLTATTTQTALPGALASRTAPLAAGDTAISPAATPATLDVMLAKRDVFLLAMHVAAIAELAYALEVSETDVEDLETITEGHLLLCRLISPLWPTVNTHYVLHLPEYIRRFGPCRAWWAFTFERINGWLSEAAGRRSNRKRDGQVEFSMMRAFSDRAAMQSVVQAQQDSSSSGAGTDSAETALWDLIGKKKGARSTIDAQSDERVYHSHPQFDTVVYNGAGREELLSNKAVQSLAVYLNTQDGSDRYQPLWSFQPGTGAVQIRSKVTIFGSLLFRGQRFVALSFRSNAHQGSTFAFARRNGVDTPCQIITIFQHRHTSAAGDDVNGQFLEVQWLQPIPWPEGHPMRRHATITKHLRCSLAVLPISEPTAMIRAREIVCQAAVTPCTVAGKPVLGIKQLYE